MTGAPVASVIVVSYEGRQRIETCLAPLLAQDMREPFEIVVVASGVDGCADHIRAAYPEVRIVSSPTRLRPGPARNRGIRVAAGEVIAFLPDDGTPREDWLRRRLELHRAGADAVGGAIVNAAPESYIARAAHLLEYSALLPVDALLKAQGIPHCLSFKRGVFERVGLYPEDTLTGEDTLFNRRCVEAGTSIAFSSEIRMGHVGDTSLPHQMRHAYVHGRGLMQCTQRHGLGSVIGAPCGLGHAAWRTLIIYPSVGLVSKLRRLSAHAPNELRALMVTSPVIALLLVSTGCGALVEWCRVDLNRDNARRA